jgi:hypothetical protein
MDPPITPLIRTTEWVDFERRLILDVEGEQWLTKTKGALFIRAANPQKEVTQQMNLEQGLTISTCWD